MTKRLRIDDVDPNLLSKNPWNTNVVSPDNDEKLSSSIDRLGFFKPIIVRETPAGRLEVLGGEHRWQHAIAKGLPTVPVTNLGPIDDKTAKEISLVDNGRYGQDDTLKLAALLDSIGDPQDLSTFMPYSSADLEMIFSSVTVSLDDLELDDDDDRAPAPTSTKKVQEFQFMKFKVPIDDAATVKAKIDDIIKTQKYDDHDSLANAGMALVDLCRR